MAEEEAFGAVQLECGYREMATGRAATSLSRSCPASEDRGADPRFGSEPVTWAETLPDATIGPGSPGPPPDLPARSV